MIWITLQIIQILDGLFNNWYIRKYGTANHALNTGYRIAIGVILVLAFRVHGPQLLFFSVGAFCGYLVLFNTELNLLRGRPVQEIGKTSTIDKFITRTGIPWEASTAWLLIISAFCVPVYYHVTDWACFVHYCP